MDNGEKTMRRVEDHECSGTGRHRGSASMQVTAFHHYHYRCYDPSSNNSSFTLNFGERQKAEEQGRWET